MLLVALVLVWSFYYGVHSLLATNGAKAAAARAWAMVPRFYRPLHNQPSMWGFLAAWHWQEGLPVPGVGRLLWLAGLGGALALLGPGLVVAALRGCDLAEFAGWKYMRSAAVPPGARHTAGLNAWVRHPLGVWCWWPALGRWPPYGPGPYLGSLPGSLCCWACAWRSVIERAIRTGVSDLPAAGTGFVAGLAVAVTKMRAA